MTNNAKIKKAKKIFMDFFFKETSDGYNSDLIGSRKHLGINLLCEEYAEKIVSQIEGDIK